MIDTAVIASTYCAKEQNLLFIGMTGICATIDPKIHLGDLIYGELYYDYGVGKLTGVYSNKKKKKWKNVFYPDIRHINGVCDEEIIETMGLSKIRAEIKNTNIDGDKPSSDLNIHKCKWGSGSSVLADKIFIKKRLIKHDRNIGAIDMEAYGLARSLDIINFRRDRKIGWLIIKGVQDYAQTETTGDIPGKSDQYRHYAAYASALFMCEYLHSYLINIDPYPAEGLEVKQTDLKVSVRDYLQKNKIKSIYNKRLPQMADDLHIDQNTLTDIFTQLVKDGILDKFETGWRVKVMEFNEEIVK
jgi:nucleoside phosphorylase